MPYGCQTHLSVTPGTTSITEFAYSTGFPQNQCACPQMVSLTIPDSVESIGRGAFDGCRNLATGDREHHTHLVCHCATDRMGGKVNLASHRGAPAG